MDDSCWFYCIREGDGKNCGWNELNDDGGGERNQLKDSGGGRGNELNDGGGGGGGCSGGIKPLNGEEMEVATAH